MQGFLDTNFKQARVVLEHARSDMERLSGRSCPYAIANGQMCMLVHQSTLLLGCTNTQGGRAKSCFAVLGQMCCAVLCCAVLCRAVLCRAVL